MHIAVTGSGGFVGRHLVARLAAAGHRVACVSRQAGPAAPGCTPRPVTSYLDEAALTRAFEGCRAVVHLAARAHVLHPAPGTDTDAAWREANVDSAVATAHAALAAGCERLVLVSSIGVNGNHTAGRAFTEQDPPDPHEPYARSKLKAEQAVQALLADGPTGWVVVRPTLVYGPGCPGNFARLVRLVQRLPLVPLGGLRRCRSLIGVQNLCDALAVAAEHPACRNRLFLLSDGEDIETATLVRLIAAGLGTEAGRIVALPAGLLEGLATLAGRRRMLDKVAGELLVNSSAFRQATGWRAALPAAEGIAATARSFLSSTASA